MARKLVNDTFDNVSWAELMFRTNVYIVGFGMGFSEIDIWWLLNKRARMIQEDKCISNTITYLYAEQFTNRTNHTAVFAAMEAFGIDDGALNPHKDYISSIFEWVK